MDFLLEFTKIRQKFVAFFLRFLKSIGRYGFSYGILVVLYLFHQCFFNVINNFEFDQCCFIKDYLPLEIPTRHWDSTADKVNRFSPKIISVASISWQLNKILLSFFLSRNFFGLLIPVLDKSFTVIVVLEENEKCVCKNGDKRSMYLFLLEK